MSKTKQSVGCDQCGHPTGPASCTGQCFEVNQVTPRDLYKGGDKLTMNDVQTEATPHHTTITKSYLDELWGHVERLTEQLKDEPENRGLAMMLDGTVRNYNSKLKLYHEQNQPWSE
jgi:hypothetical protein